MPALPAKVALDSFFLEARCRLLDIAAFLDRVDRGDSKEAVQDDPRMKKILQACELLQKSPGQRAEQIQRLFSLEYDSEWVRPQPRS